MLKCVHNNDNKLFINNSLRFVNVMAFAEIFFKHLCDLIPEKKPRYSDF